ncbi:C25 family cysteine peptidase [Mucilaginibacter agri]|uniref:Gingipain domain-containing protein n=1 Tax=Mucilaginibacter agri TaxID=2695265 RepID=A0A965ZM81_9SPHI|nr:C25 family cysteine peptidase [Mucilaginibacter agri]NCD72509.1 hypothetical protein [Mucilaginibacter agri]
MRIYFEDRNHREKREESFLFHAEISPDQVIIRETPFGIQFKLGKDFQLANKPGTPALPSKIIRVALPADAMNIEVLATVKKTYVLTKKPVFIMPVPNYQIAADHDHLHDKSGGGERKKWGRAMRSEPYMLRSIPSPKPKMVFRAKEYDHFLQNPPPVAEYVSEVLIGNNKMVNIRVHPVTLNAESIPQLNQVIEVKVKYQRLGDTAYDRKSIIRSRSNNDAVSKVLINHLKDKVINPREVIDLREHFPFYRQYDYLIITDNNVWDSDKITSKRMVGDNKTVFEKLAAWKRQKGLSATVVAVTDIVNGLYGDFKTGAVDLQEVLRNFLKFAHASWGVTWCLLGGDVEIIPVRQVAGEIRGDVNEQTVNDPPNDNEAFWATTFMKIKVVSLGEWFTIYDNYLRLTNQQTGQLIPQKAPAVSLSQIVLEKYKQLPSGVFESTTQFRDRLGWYFCTDETYMHWSSTPTNFVRVDGPAAIIHAQLRFHYTWNTIPTDMYYSSLVGPNYSVPGKHDWDFNNNRIYGQHEGKLAFDPINWHSDIIVGRAPVSSPGDAETFVNKVIAYEKFHTENGTPLDRNYLDKMLLVSSNWGGRFGYWGSATNPPPAGSYYTQADQKRAILQTTDDVAIDWNWELLSWIDDDNVSEIPYNAGAGPFHKGWFFAKSPTDLSPAVLHIVLPFGIHFDFPMVTHTIVIYGTDAEIQPNHFVLDSKDADGSMMDQEALREQVDAEIAILKRFNRLYEDVDSLSPANLSAAPVSRLNDAVLTAALNEGQHFLSLSGHGNQGGCCGVDDNKAADSANGTNYFITFADSCLTNGFDAADSMSEFMLNNGGGGAVAYVGHTRFSWIGLGDDFQREFFHTLVNTHHVGLMHDSRFTLLTDPDDHYQKWSILALNLLGDPEMEIWTRKPITLLTSVFFLKDKLYVKAYNKDDLARNAIKKLSVKVHLDERVYHLEPDEEGGIGFDRDWLKNENILLTVSAPGSLPFQLTSMNLNELAGKELTSELLMLDEWLRAVPEQTQSNCHGSSGQENQGQTVQMTHYPAAE